MQGIIPQKKNPRLARVLIVGAQNWILNSLGFNIL